jgi:hypothetical protein
MPQKIKNQMMLNVSVPLNVFNEISARADAQCTTRAAVARLVLVDWLKDLPEGSKASERKAA